MIKQVEYTSPSNVYMHSTNSNDKQQVDKFKINEQFTKNFKVLNDVFLKDLLKILLINCTDNIYSYSM